MYEGRRRMREGNYQLTEHLQVSPYHANVGIISKVS
jgi:hypothetical protein